MTEIYRGVPAGEYGIEDLDPLGDECSSGQTIAVTIGVNLSTGQDGDGEADPASDRLRFYSDQVISEVELDAAIAAYPTTVQGATGTVEVERRVPFLLVERVIPVGFVGLVDIHLLVSLGDVSGARVEALDTYALVHREDTGNVKITGVEGADPGNIPGFRVRASGTATMLQIHATTGVDGTMTVHKNTIDIKMSGTLAP